MELGADGITVGVYWSRTLATAVAVGLAPAATWPDNQLAVPTGLGSLLPADVLPELLEVVPERNIQGRLWELPGLDRDAFPM